LRLAADGVRKLRRIARDFKAYWPRRNQAGPSKCDSFLHWRIADYRRGTLPL